MAGKFKLDIRKTSDDATSRGCLRVSGTIGSICSALVSLQQPHIEYLDHISFGDYQVGRKATSTCSFSGSVGLQSPTLHAYNPHQLFKKIQII
jgi:hypothetical protein